MDVFEKLRSSKDLTENDRAIIAYILDNPDLAAHATTRDLAQSSLTSPSAVTRLARKLGYKSFNDLKLAIATDLRRAKPGTTEMSPNERALSASAKVAELEATVIAETRRTLDLTAVQRAADVLNAAAEIDVCARDTNVILASYAAHLFSLAGSLTSVRESIDPIIRYTALVPRGHASMLISRGGHDTTLQEAARNLRARGVPTILVTTALDSPLADLCDTVIGCHYGDLETFGEVVFHTSVRYVLDTLFTMLFSEDFEDNRRLALDHYNICSQRIYGDDGWSKEKMSRL